MSDSESLMKLFRGADVYAPEHLGRRDVLVCGGRIAAIEEHLEPNLPNVEVIEAAGKIMIPGLVDEHVHVTGGGGESGFSSRVGELSMEHLTAAGVTTVIGVLGTDSITRNVESLLAKVKALKEEGMSAWCLTGSYAIDSPTITGSVKKDVCFIDEILGVKLAINDHRCSMPTLQELIRLTADVRLASLTAGKPGVVHMHTGRGKQGFQIIFDALQQSDLPIRHFRPTHCGGNLADAITFGKMGGIIDFSASEEYQKTVSDLMAAFKEVPMEQITLSSDAGGSLPVWNEKKEMIGMKVGMPDTLLPVIRALWKEEKLPLEQVLTLVTKNPADSLMLGQKGRIAEGADADFVFVSDKLEVEEVYCMGRRVR